jgi:hypothetical protein
LVSSIAVTLLPAPKPDASVSQPIVTRALRAYIRRPAQGGVNQVSARVVAAISACIALAGCAITLVPGDTQWANASNGSAFLFCDPQMLVCENANGVGFDVVEGPLPNNGFQLIGGLRAYPVTVFDAAHIKLRAAPAHQVYFDQKWARVKLYLQQQPSLQLGTAQLFFSPHPPLFPRPMPPLPADQPPVPQSHVAYPVNH